MQPSDREQPQRGRRVVAAIAVLALLGLILAVLIASCSGQTEPAAETGAAAETATEETATAETGAEAEEPAETAEQETAPAETEAAETDTGETTTEPDDTTTGGDDEEAGPATVLDAATEAGTFGTLVGLLEQSGLDTTLAGDGPFTLLAPTDEAFAALPEELLAALEDEPDALEQFLSYHVVPERIAPDVLVPGNLDTLEGAPLEIAERDGRLYVEDAPILEPAVEAGNGWLYPVGLVLLPPDLDLTDLVGEDVAAEAYDRADFVVFFATGSADLDADAQETIAEAATEIEGLPAGSRVRLVGVADPTGDAAANLELSRQRARAVQAALEQAAPDAQVRYVVRAVGEEEAPELANARRVDIVLIPSG